MSKNDISISVGGKKYTGWKSVQITQSLETLSSQFMLSVVDKHDQKSNEDWLLRPQDECVIYLGDDKLITGYIDDVSNNIAADTHEIKINGRDKTGDLVDCNYIEPLNSWSKKNLFNFAITLCEPFGIGVSKSSDIDISQTFAPTVNKSDTVFENINKHAKDLGILFITDSEGNVLLTNSGNTKTNDVLEYGKNIKRGNVSHTYSERFSKYILEAQTSIKSNNAGWGSNIKIKAETSDDGIKRYRPKLIKSSRPLTNAIAKKTVQWESSYRAGQSQTFNITVQGFRQSNDDIWKINTLVDVYAPPLYINPMTELLIVGITFILNESGSITQLQLKRKDVYTKKPGTPKNVKAVNSLGWDRLNRQKSGADARNLEIGGKPLG